MRCSRLARAAARQEVGRDEAAVRQAANGVEADRLGRDGAADPRHGGRRRRGVDLEHFDRLPRAVTDDEQLVHRAVPGAT